MSKEGHLFVTIRDSLKNIEQQADRLIEYQRQLNDNRKQIIRDGYVPLNPYSGDLFGKSANVPCKPWQRNLKMNHVYAPYVQYRCSILKESINHLIIKEILLNNS